MNAIKSPGLSEAPARPHPAARPHPRLGERLRAHSPARSAPGHEENRPARQLQLVRRPPRRLAGAMSGGAATATLSLMRSSRKHCTTRPTSKLPGHASRPRPRSSGRRRHARARSDGIRPDHRGKQSYDFLVPRQALPEGWNGYGSPRWIMSYETRLLGQEPRGSGSRRLGGARCRGRDRTDASRPLDLPSPLPTPILFISTRCETTRPTRSRCALQTVALFRQRHHFGLETLGERTAGRGAAGKRQGRSSW